MDCQLLSSQQQQQILYRCKASEQDGQLLVNLS